MTGSSCFATSLVCRPQAQAALSYAEHMHAGQQRGDGTPFISHPFEVAVLLADTGASDHVVAAGAMHDLLEKTTATESELEKRFGAQITELVLAVTDDDRIHAYGARKAALRRQVAAAGEDALTLFAADKLSKLRELRREASADPGQGRGRAVRTRRLKHYQRSLAMLEERLPKSPLVRHLHEELHDFLRERRDRAVHAVAGA